jgi:hypothetical protein
MSGSAVWTPFASALALFLEVQIISIVNKTKHSSFHFARYCAVLYNIFRTKYPNKTPRNGPVIEFPQIVQFNAGQSACRIWRLLSGGQFYRIRQKQGRWSSDLSVHRNAHRRARARARASKKFVCPGLTFILIVRSFIDLKQFLITCLLIIKSVQQSR